MVCFIHADNVCVKHLSHKIKKSHVIGQVQIYNFSMFYVKIQLFVWSRFSFTYGKKFSQFPLSNSHSKALLIKILNEHQIFHIYMENFTELQGCTANNFFY